MARRAWSLLAGMGAMLGALGACSAPGQSYDAAMPPAMGAPPPLPPPARRAVAILVPLSGSNAERGQALLHAAQLALAPPGSPTLDARDTGGTPEGAAAAARAALAAGDVALLGPLTAGETASVAPLAQAAGVPELAFTNDTAQARPGVWVLGITPGQQVRRLVAAARADGRTRIAAVLPNSPFGTAMTDAYAQASLEAPLAAAPASGPVPGSALRYEDPRGLADALRDVSDYASRHQAQQAAQAAAAPPAEPAPVAPPPSEDQSAPPPGSLASVIAGLKGGQPPASGQPAPPLGPPPIDALLLAETGAGLRAAVPELQADGLMPPAVRLLGPAQWAQAHLPALAGAWYAAPDPASRSTFVAQYAAANGTPPLLLSDLAYDAAAIVRAAGATGPVAASLTRPQGFAGVDGVLALLPDGRVRRGLALFELTPDGGSRMVQPAPAALAGSGA